MRKINNFNSILYILCSTFPLEVEVKSQSVKCLEVLVPYFPSSLCHSFSSKILFSVHSFDGKILINFYL